MPGEDVPNRESANDAARPQARVRPLWAIIFKPWADEPIYHAHKRVFWYDPDFRGHKWLTRCGRPIGEHTPWLPMKHVVKIGRPCRGCFPQ